MIGIVWKRGLVYLLRQSISCLVTSWTWAFDDLKWPLVFPMFIIRKLENSEAREGKEQFTK